MIAIQHGNACSIPCNLCGGTEVSILSSRSRSGKPLRTVICRACGLVWSDPRPHDARQFYEEEYRLSYKHSYSPKPKHVLRAGHVALSRFEKIEPLLSSRKAVLDVGTGGGEFAYLLQSLGHRVSGIEPNRGYADYSIQEYGLSVQVGFVQDATFPPESFDVVTIWHVLEHTEDPGFILALLRSWLKPEGTLVVEVPNVEATCQAPSSTFHEAHLYNFNVVSLRRLAKKHGLYETKHLISRDGGNITMFLSCMEPLVQDRYEASIPGNCEWISRIVRQHSNVRRHLTPMPYLRAWQRLCRTLQERRETAYATTGKALLDKLYSPQVTCMLWDVDERIRPVHESSALNSARILLIKPSSLGDIVHAFPVVSAIKAQWPGSHITWVVKRQWTDLVERAVGIDRVWPVDMTVGSWIMEGRALRAERFDLVIDLQGLFRSGILAWLSGAPTRIGFANGREGSPWFYTNRVPVLNPDVHAVDRYLSVVAALGASLPDKPRFGFRLLEEDMATVREICQRRGLTVDRPWVAMNVGARWPTKRWPLTSFAAVVDRLYKAQPNPVVVIGSSEERPQIDSLKTLAKNPFIDLCGEIPLRCLPALLSTATAMITNDSGPMHIAAALGIPVIAMFGPTSARRTGPYGTGHRVLSGQVSCSPCFSRVCRHNPHMECLHLVTLAQVVEAVQPMLAAHVVSR